MIREVKKLSCEFIRYLLTLAMLFMCFAPMRVEAAKKEASTLRELRGELKELQAQKNANASKKALTKSEINAKNNAINDASNEIEKSRQQITEAKALIDTTEKQITELENKNEELLAYFQVMQGENVFLEFITDSSSMTELIMRSDAINQLVEYQQDKLVELNDLIKKNEQLQVDLIKKEDKLAKDIVNYESKVAELQDNLSDLNAIGLDIDDEIRSKKELIKAYEDMGCKEDQDLQECSSLAGTAQWYKPFAKGRVNSIFGKRVDPFTGKIKIHKAVDIGGTPEGTKVYAVANGIVIATTDAKAKLQTKGKKTCGGNQVVMKVMVAGKTYIVGYAHLLKINVKVGQKVTVNDVIGLQGGGPKTRAWETCSTGTHVHVSVSEGEPKKNQSLSSYVNAHAIVPPGYPGKGGWWYSRTQFFK